MRFGGYVGGRGFEGGEEERVCGAVAAEGAGEEVAPGAEHGGTGEEDEDFDADELGGERVSWGDRGISFRECGREG